MLWNSEGFIQVMALNENGVGESDDFRLCSRISETLL